MDYENIKEKLKEAYKKIEDYKKIQSQFENKMAVNHLMNEGFVEAQNLLKKNIVWVKIGKIE